MSKKTYTKRALLSSVIALILCCAMLLGTTFAWFTDNASTAVNSIESGTLDVQLLDAEGNSLEGKTLTFKDLDNNKYWEPGASYELNSFKIKNSGNLALKYKVEISGIGGDAKLNEVIDWKMIINNSEFALNALSDKELLPGATTSSITIVGKMQETAGNEYQNMTIENIAITVHATQAAEEYDSYNNTYDENAMYADVISVTDATELSNVINSIDQNKNTEIKLPTADSSNPIETNFRVEGGKDVTLSGATDDPADTVLDGQIAATSNGTLIIRNVTINVDDTLSDSTGISQTGKSGIAVWGDQDVICENVVFNINKTDATAVTAWWSTGDGANITLKNCVFNCNGQRPVRSDASVTIEGCTFNDPYRYAVQMTSKSSTITAPGNAVLNFNNNKIIAGSKSTKPVYGVQLEGESYGCSYLTINGSGNTIDLNSTGKTGIMYVYEDTAKVHDITWNVSDGTPTAIS